MAKHTGRHTAKRSKVAGIAVFLVLMLSGFLLTTNLRVNRSVVVSNDTAELVEQRVKKVNSLRKEVDGLSSKVDDLSKTLNSTDGDDAQDGESAGAGTMLPAVEGPGLVVTLNDSPLWKNMVDSSGSTSNINDYVIHQQDVEAVVNALWAGGAESMMIMDQRVLFNSAVRCSGNVLLLQGKKYSPPFKISAIGPVDRMQQALNDSKEIAIYRQYVSAFGLGWKVEKKDKLHFDATDALQQPLKYAKVIESDDSNEDAEQKTEEGNQ
ncbi:DUF881 domain-containing protein [Bifidobacterium moukalabense]|jgi:uncharacterized protein YlxW (UPF0749 family)|uniref:Membrane protein n=1 Tax=Bifidobacterium moukalabense DSM 27321 TaxID=1435051 RepID=W4N677_9BIFI|nr:DUF881 domain-containing protein [Bifidobacterium moukalabense]ETY70484.1 membrane protein [Bifidobacterium moukalabense DSM 27321]